MIRAVGARGMPGDPSAHAAAHDRGGRSDRDGYERRAPENGPLYQVLREHLETLELDSLTP